MVTRSRKKGTEHPSFEQDLRTTEEPALLEATDEDLLGELLHRIREEHPDLKLFGDPKDAVEVFSDVPNHMLPALKKLRFYAEMLHRCGATNRLLRLVDIDLRLNVSRNGLARGQWERLRSSMHPEADFQNDRGNPPGMRE